MVGELQVQAENSREFLLHHRKQLESAEVCGEIFERCFPGGTLLIDVPCCNPQFSIQSVYLGRYLRILVLQVIQFRRVCAHLTHLVLYLTQGTIELGQRSIRKVVCHLRDAVHIVLPLLHCDGEFLDVVCHLLGPISAGLAGVVQLLIGCLQLLQFCLHSPNGGNGLLSIAGNDDFLFLRTHVRCVYLCSKTKIA